MQLKKHHQNNETVLFGVSEGKKNKYMDTICAVLKMYLELEVLQLLFQTNQGESVPLFLHSTSCSVFYSPWLSCLHFFNTLDICRP